MDLACMFDVGGRFIDRLDQAMDQDDNRSHYQGRSEVHPDTSKHWLCAQINATTHFGQDNVHAMWLSAIKQQDSDRRDEDETKSS